MRVEERACPFCAGALRGLAAPAPLPTMRLSRAALFVAATLGVAACNEPIPATKDPVAKPKPTQSATKPPPVDDGGPDDPGASQAEYGAPAPKPKPPVGGADGGPDDEGTSHPKYGGPGLIHPPIPAPSLLPPKAPKAP